MHARLHPLSSSKKSSEVYFIKTLHNPEDLDQVSSNSSFFQCQQLEAVKQERDLVVIIAEDLKPSARTESYTKANCMLGLIKRTVSSRQPGIMLNLYKSIVRPHLEYCSPVTGQNVPPVKTYQSVSVKTSQYYWSPWVKTSHQPKCPTSMVKTPHVGMAIQNVPIQNVPASLVKTSLC